MSSGVAAPHLGVWVAGVRGPDPYPLASPPEGKAHREHREKLELVASFSFFGNVMSMASVQLAGAKRDALLLSFKDAKVGGGLGGGSRWGRPAGGSGARWWVVGGGAGQGCGEQAVLTPRHPSCPWWSMTQAPMT